MIIANLATYPARAHILEQAVTRLAPQVETLNVVLNEHDEIPAWMAKFENLNPVLPEEDFKDIGKFVPQAPVNSIVILVDDDLIYPADYVSRMVDGAMAAGIFEGKGAIGGLHGTHYRKILSRVSAKDLAKVLLRRNFRVGAFRKTWCFWKALNHPVRVDQIGTGTAILPARLMPNLEVMQSGKRYADVKLAQWAHQNEIPIVALPRPEGWLLGDDQEETIYSTFTSKMPNDLSREISEFAFKVPGSGEAWFAP